ncbi:MAG: hypothetical protein H6773_00300 [Pseudomonadales bacterium]|nr:hypothetical protein [Pseudomonadales bacterium]
MTEVKQGQPVDQEQSVTKDYSMRLEDLRRKIVRGNIGGVDVVSAVNVNELVENIKPGIAAIAKELHEIYDLAPANVPLWNGSDQMIRPTPHIFMQNVIVLDIASSIRDQIEIRDLQQLPLSPKGRGAIPGLMLLLEFDRIRTQDEEDKKFNSTTWRELLDLYHRSLQPVGGPEQTIVTNQDFKTAVEITGYDPVHK